jgi:hypothetical protein
MLSTDREEHTGGFGVPLANNSAKAFVAAGITASGNLVVDRTDAALLPTISECESNARDEIL